MRYPHKQTGKTKKANNAIFWVLRIIFTLFLYLMFGFLFDYKSAKNIKRPCLILSNHHSGIDQFVLSMGFTFGMNFVATDSLFRHGLLSKLMVALVQPIPFSKGSSDITAVKNMMSVIKDGGAVVMFPSGNRSCYGMESTIVAGIGKLAKMFKAPLVLVQLKGGYFIKPRWMNKHCWGKMRATVTKVVSTEELAAMSNEEVDSIINDVLHFNDYEYNKTAQNVYRGRRRAEYLESMLFYCPQCSSICGLCSKGSDFFCRDCNARVRINGMGFFDRINNAENIPDTILAWSYLQLDYIKSFDFSGYTDKPAFSDGNITFFKVERARREEFLAAGSIELYADRLVVCEREYFFTDITMAIIGSRKMSIYHKNDVFAVIVPHRINLMKYMICGYHLRNKALGITEEFYGY